MCPVRVRGRKDSQRRYRSVEALMSDIDHYLKGEPPGQQPLRDQLPVFRVRRHARDDNLGSTNC